jgi:serine/threonine protein kinase
MSELKLQQCRLDGRYDLLDCLGRGSYAEIYKAHDKAALPGEPTIVVVKALNLLLQDAPDDELERTLVANFQNEAVALDRVRHPNIISRLGHGTAIDLDGTTFHYILLEYLSGGDMFALTKNKPLPLNRMLSYLEQVCSGLAHAHKCGVIHRDIKPQNLLLTGDKLTVKIADFGVARLEANEGAITRVGTSIYSAPEHNPLMQTSQLDRDSFLHGRPQLTPSADIYSLAKTVYTLLAGEAPRRFAQHPITDLPPLLQGKYWSKRLLHVMEQATQDRAADRQQSVEEFWEELADAALPDTQELPASLGRETSRPVSAELRIEPEEMTQAPPRPRFEVPRAEPVNASVITGQRPKIVVPVAYAQTQPGAAAALTAERRSASEIIAAFPNERTRTPLAKQKNGNAQLPYKDKPVPGPGKRFLVAATLVVLFSGMLLATHRYVTSRWNPLADLPELSNTFVVGKEGFTTTDLNLRPNPNAENQPIGLAENGSRVKVLAINSNWYEVQVLQHARPKVDQFTSDRGWVNKKYLRFD